MNEMCRQTGPSISVIAICALLVVKGMVEYSRLKFLFPQNHFSKVNNLVSTGVGIANVGIIDGPHLLASWIR